MTDTRQLQKDRETFSRVTSVDIQMQRDSYWRDKGLDPVRNDLETHRIAARIIQGAKRPSVDEQIAEVIQELDARPPHPLNKFLRWIWGKQ